MGGILSRKDDDGDDAAALGGDAAAAGAGTVGGRQDGGDDPERGGGWNSSLDPSRQASPSREDGSSSDQAPNRGGACVRKRPASSLSISDHPPLPRRERRRVRRKAQRQLLEGSGSEPATGSVPPAGEAALVPVRKNVAINPDSDPTTEQQFLKIEARVVPLELNGRPVVTPSAGGGYCCATGGDVVAYVRMVQPYPYTFTSYAKKRWLGRTVLEVYADEFQSYPLSYYQAALAEGRITVNGARVPSSYRIRGGDILRHSVHRHEPAVRVSSNEPPLIRIVASTPDCLVVDKPPCLPIHPCGGYHENSLVRILEREDRNRAIMTARSGHRDLFKMVHRLDRLTSGLVVLAKSSKVAAQWTDAIRSRTRCQKLYLARVRGRFPDNLFQQSPFLAPPCLTAEHDGASIPVALPDYGEWLGREGHGDEEEKEVNSRRHRHAHGWWISDASDIPLPGTSPGALVASLESNPDNPTEERLREVLELLSEQFAASSSSVSHREEAASEANDSAQLTEKDRNQQPRPFYWVHLACPIRIVDPKIGVYECDSFGGLDDAEYIRTVKPAQTSFAALSYHGDSDSTLLLCRPQTGRTHQIRLHLRHLGHPIANDPNYGGDAWYYDPRGRAACQRAQGLLDSDNNHSSAGEGAAAMSSSSSSSLVTSDQPATEQEMEACAVLPARADGEPLDSFLRRTCVWCRRNASGREDRSALELMVRSSGIWLHALQYSALLAQEGSSDSGKIVTYRTPLPGWSVLGAAHGRTAEEG